MKTIQLTITITATLAEHGLLNGCATHRYTGSSFFESSGACLIVQRERKHYSRRLPATRQSEEALYLVQLVSPEHVSLFSKKENTALISCQPHGKLKRLYTLCCWSNRSQKWKKLFVLAVYIAACRGQSSASSVAMSSFQLQKQSQPGAPALAHPMCQHACDH